jgi:hypothetical protein
MQTGEQLFQDSLRSTLVSGAVLNKGKEKAVNLSSQTPVRDGFLSALELRDKSREVGVIAFYNGKRRNLVDKNTVGLYKGASA